MTIYYTSKIGEQIYSNKNQHIMYKNIHLFLSKYVKKKTILNMLQNYDT